VLTGAPGAQPARQRRRARSRESGRIPHESQQRRIEAHGHQLQAYEGLCRELGAKPADVALDLRGEGGSPASDLRKERGPPWAPGQPLWQPRGGHSVPAGPMRAC